MSIPKLMYDLLRILFVSVIIGILCSIFTISSALSVTPTKVRSSGNLSTSSRFTDSSGRSLGTKRTYDYGHTVQNYYYDRSGKYVGKESQNRSLLDNTRGGISRPSSNQKKK